jgi:hypothetical protein
MSSPDDNAAGAFAWLTRERLAEVASLSPKCKAPDQWGWRVREHLAFLLSDETVGACLVSYVFAPVAFGTSVAAVDDYAIGG